MVKDQARSFSEYKDFIASKGWLDKFKIRFNLMIFKDSVTKDSIVWENDSQMNKSDLDSRLKDFSNSSSDDSYSDDLLETSDSIMIQSDS